jgi:thiol-disulfide isomerase/thioredoxin
LAALTAVVTALSIGLAVNLALTLAIIRRLRLQQPQPSHQLPLPPIGMQAPVLFLKDHEGRSIDRSFYMGGGAVVAFLTHHCVPCDRAKTDLLRGPIAESLLVVLQTAPDLREEDFVNAIARAGARVVVLDSGSDLPGRFSIRAFPTFLRLQDGVVVASAARLADVRAEVANPMSANGRESHAPAEALS